MCLRLFNLFKESLLEIRAVRSFWAFPEWVARPIITRRNQMPRFSFLRFVPLNLSHCSSLIFSIMALSSFDATRPRRWNQIFFASELIIFKKIFFRLEILKRSKEDSLRILIFVTSYIFSLTASDQLSFTTCLSPNSNDDLIIRIGYLITSSRTIP